jgi:hypothetical protein
MAYDVIPRFTTQNAESDIENLRGNSRGKDVNINVNHSLMNL